MPVVRPEVLIWARETAGMSLAAAAAKLGLRAARGLTPEVRLAAIEAGQAPLTRPMLLKMAKAYHRPLVSFYLPAPPRRGEHGEDFRSPPERTTEYEPLVDAVVRDVRARQAMVRSTLEDDEASPLRFVDSMTMADGVGAVLADIRRALRLELSEFRAQGSAESAFALLRSRAESLGVFVLLIGNLGSHHSTIEASAFRGFALADSLAPFVVINDQDAKPAWSFTLIHELAHLWLGTSGISGTFAESHLEQFCNDVASNFLLPGGEVAASGIDRKTPLDEAVALISTFASERLLSRSMVAFRLYREGLIAEQSWQELRGRFRGQWLARREKEREQRPDGAGGPNYYVVRRHRLGSAILQFVARGMSDGAITPTKAGKILGVKARSVAPLLSGASLKSRVA